MFSKYHFVICFHLEYTVQSKSEKIYLIFSKMKGSDNLFVFNLLLTFLKHCENYIQIHIYHCSTPSSCRLACKPKPYLRKILTTNKHLSSSLHMEASQAKTKSSVSHLNKNLVQFTSNTLLSWLLKHHFAALFLVPSCLFAKCYTYL